MLKEFSVTNFKNFKNKTTFSLCHPGNYEFNTEVVRNGIVDKAIVYGPNGSGKSNLALAMFDIITHLTDKERIYMKYSPYLNLNSNKRSADFEYKFDFDGNEVIYKYSKTDVQTLLNESLSINGQEVLAYDFTNEDGYTTLKGAENFQLTGSQNNNVSLSRVKFLYYNVILQNDEINVIFYRFMDFVNRMLMFYSLNSNGYQGLTLGADNCSQRIISENKLEDFQKFLAQNGIEYDLVARDNFGGIKEIYCKFPKGEVPLSLLASTGTKSLMIFYYWHLLMSKASLVFIDEYDAFYHFELSQDLVKLLKTLTNTQVILTSHNTDLMSNDLLRPDAYFIIENGKIKPLNKCTDKDLRQAHNLQKMYKAGSFNE